MVKFDLCLLDPFNHLFWIEINFAYRADLQCRFRSGLAILDIQPVPPEARMDGGLPGTANSEMSLRELEAQITEFVADSSSESSV